MPLVSVLMTVYNREAYIAEAIESVLASSYTNFELIIVDDCSTDRSVEIALTFSDPRIQLHLNEKNLTDYPNRNKAASYARGKYLKYLDSDDVIYKHGLENTIDRMEEFPEAGLGLAKWSLPDKPFPILLLPRECYQWSFLQNRYIFSNAPSSSIIRRDVFEEMGGFSGLNQVGDAEFWLKIATKHPILLIECGQGWSRDHPVSEKYKDSPAVRAKMNYEVNRKALMDSANPLTLGEKEIALKLLDKNFKKERLKYLARHYFINPFGSLLKKI